MAAYTQHHNLIATLTETEAELKNLVMLNTGDSQANTVFIQAADQIRCIIDELHNRPGLSSSEEAQLPEG